MPFPVYLPFFPGQQPNLIFSREAAIDDYDEYLSLADDTTSADVFEREVPADGVALDAGCGGGRWLIRLHRLGRRVVGLDLHAPALLGVRRQAAAIPLLQGAVSALPLRAASLAAVISLGVVEHAEEGPEAALREFARVLRPGGRLLVSVPFANPVRRLVMHPLFRLRHGTRADDAHYFVEYRFTRAEILSALRRCGLQPLSCHPYDFRPPRCMGLVSDFNILATRFERRDGGLHLHLSDYRMESELPGWRGWAARLLPRLSPWLATAEILVVAEKTGAQR